MRIKLTKVNYQMGKDENGKQWIRLGLKAKQVVGNKEIGKPCYISAWGEDFPDLLDAIDSLDPDYLDDSYAVFEESLANVSDDILMLYPDAIFWKTETVNFADITESATWKRVNKDGTTKTTKSGEPIVRTQMVVFVPYIIDTIPGGATELVQLNGYSAVEQVTRELNFCWKPMTTSSEKLEEKINILKDLFGK